MNEVQFRTGVISPVECFKEAWEIIKDEYLLIFAITAVGLMIGGVIPIFLSGPMLAGIYFCLFQKIDGKSVSFEQLFKGFDYFLPSVILMAIITNETHADIWLKLFSFTIFLFYLSKI